MIRVSHYKDVINAYFYAKLENSLTKENLIKDRNINYLEKA